ncbi:hypothetical protein DSL92_00495 [Billgrantia gudaonensis]|uniref:Uncharacterized protein n=1 Tax=Billgrantia gudaonensis TaxID=376427 RepID=A0A3S0NFC2_9GAMM|nr:hypothetical protein DSL92_00495 [Halomonas gudaonensis]
METVLPGPVSQFPGCTFLLLQSPLAFTYRYADAALWRVHSPGNRAGLIIASYACFTPLPADMAGVQLGSLARGTPVKQTLTFLLASVSLLAALATATQRELERV